MSAGATCIDLIDFGGHLLEWLERVRGGEEVTIVDQGRVIARVMPPTDRRDEARRALLALRAVARVDDVESPIDEPWDAAADRP